MISVYGMKIDSYGYMFIEEIIEDENVTVPVAHMATTANGFMIIDIADSCVSLDTVGVVA